MQGRASFYPLSPLRQKKSFPPSPLSCRVRKPLSSPLPSPPFPHWERVCSLSSSSHARRKEKWRRRTMSTASILHLKVKAFKVKVECQVELEVHWLEWNRSSFYFSLAAYYLKARCLSSMIGFSRELFWVNAPIVLTFKARILLLWNVLLKLN